jgi:hypothetical protein
LEPFELSYRCIVSHVKNSLPPVPGGQAKSGNRIIPMDRVNDTFTIALNNGFPRKQFL